MYSIVSSLTQFQNCWNCELQEKYLLPTFSKSFNEEFQYFDAFHNQERKENVVLFIFILKWELTNITVETHIFLLSRRDLSDNEQ